MRKTSTGLDSNDKSCRTNYTEVHVGLMLPLIFQSLCGHKISFVQHFTRIHLYLEQRIGLYEIMCKLFFRRNILCALQVFLCALVLWLAQFRGNIANAHRHMQWLVAWLLDFCSCSCFNITRVLSQWFRRRQSVLEPAHISLQ